MMKRLFIVALICLTSYSAFALSMDEPDLQKLLTAVKARNVKLEVIDDAAFQLQYYEKTPPSAENEQNLLDVYKAISAGYAANFHFKQGLIVFQRYLTLKENKLAREKEAAVADMKQEFAKKEQTDEAEITRLQKHVEKLSSENNKLLFRTSSFKKGFPATIIILSLLFTLLLFRTGMRLKSLKAETRAKHDKLMQDYRISILGILKTKAVDSVSNNQKQINAVGKDLVSFLSSKAPADPNNEFVNSIAQKFNEIEKLGNE